MQGVQLYAPKALSQHPSIVSGARHLQRTVWSRFSFNLFRELDINMNVSVKLVLHFLRRDIILLISENPQFAFHKVLHFNNTENAHHKSS